MFPLAPRRLPRHLVFIGMAALVVVLDQATKALVRATLDRGESWPEGWPIKFTHVTNSGAAFGLFQNQAVFLAATTVFAIGAIFLYYRNPTLRHGLVGPALGLVLGGAIGNFIDRVRVGYVTDFVHFPSYPKFNVADSAITIGVVVILALIVLSEGRAERSEDGAP